LLLLLLRRAIMAGHLETMQRLIVGGAGVNHQCSNGYSPLLQVGTVLGFLGPPGGPGGGGIQTPTSRPHTQQACEPFSTQYTGWECSNGYSPLLQVGALYVCRHRTCMLTKIHPARIVKR
jgi:hypothetical protein